MARLEKGKAFSGETLYNRDNAGARNTAPSRSFFSFPPKGSKR
jgi:hypothetical protein